MYRIKKYRMTRFSLFTRVFVLVIKDWYTEGWKKEDYAEYKGVVLSRKELMRSESIVFLVCEVSYWIICSLIDKVQLFIAIFFSFPVNFFVSVAIVSFFLTIKYERENLR